MQKIAFLTSTAAPENADDVLAAKALVESGRYLVDFIPWQAKTDWRTYDLVIIRSTWDYTLHLEAFLRTLEAIEAAGTKLLNPASVVKWNQHKGYLASLEKSRVLIVPTLFFEGSEEVTIPLAWSQSRFIIKPCISASARDTHVLTREEIVTRSFRSKLFKGDWMLQPFLENITRGEISLHYFGGRFSHGVLKVPKAGDFRVQEEHGGRFQTYVPSDELQQLGQKILSNIKEPLLYARVDLIPYENSYALMELELIEPFLNFVWSAHAPGNFMNAVDQF